LLEFKKKLHYIRCVLIIYNTRRKPAYILHTYTTHCKKVVVHEISIRVSRFGHECDVWHIRVNVCDRG
jgi:hypothetical protein